MYIVSFLTNLHLPQGCEDSLFLLILFRCSVILVFIFSAIIHFELMYVNDMSQGSLFSL